jgi:nitroreductase
LDVFEAVKNRRSVRAFTNEPVSNKEVKKLIDLARWAPSAGNIQPWVFIVVRSPTKRRQLSEAANQGFIEEAPVVIVVCADTQRSRQGYGSRGANLYCIQDTAAATQNMLLSAHSMGLATCWVGAFHEEKAKTALDLPVSVRPVAIIPVGHAAEKPRTRSRRPLNTIIHSEAFGEEKASE